MWRKKNSVNKLDKILPENCNHIWKDFDWYIAYNYDNYSRTGTIEIYEPYVCLLCHERKDIILEKMTMTRVTLEQFHDQIKEIKEEKEYKIKDRLLVEDEVNDAILVDRQKLSIAEKVLYNYEKATMEVCDKLNNPMSGQCDIYKIQHNEKAYQEGHNK